MLILKRPWTRQPQTVVRPASQFADMAVCWLASNPTQNIGNIGLTFTKNGATTRSISKIGVGEYSGTYTTNNTYTGPTVNPSTANWPGVTVVAVVKHNAQNNNTFPGVITFVPNGAYYGGFNLTCDRQSTGEVGFAFRAGNSGIFIATNAYNAAPAGSTVAAEDVTVVVAGFDKKTIWIVQNRNGEITSNSNAHAFGWVNANCIFQMLGYTYTTARSIMHSTAMVAAIPRDLRAEAERIACNPWQIFAPQQIIIPTAVAAASSLPTLSASTFVPGSLTSTGWRPRVTATY